MMRRVLVSCLAVLMAAGIVGAKLRTRYCYCVNHDASVSTSCSGKSYSFEWMGKVYPGIWDGWDNTTGFDNVSDPKGDLSGAPGVSAAYWIDSAFESNDAATRKNAPLVDGWALESDLVDPNYQLSGDGYFVIAAGGIKIDQAGTYEFRAAGDDGGVGLWIDKNRDGTIDLTSGNATSETECLTGTLRDPGNIWAWSFAGGKDASSAVPVTFAQAGLYKVVIWYWDWGEIGHCQLWWKKPGGTQTPIPGSAFGKVSGGPPKVSITDVKVNGATQTKSNWGNLDVNECVPVTFTAEATGMQGETPVYVWDFYGNGSAKLETAEPVVEYKYAADPSVFLIQPSVRVKRGAALSAPSSNTDVIFIWLTDDPAVSGCGAVTSAAKPAAGPAATRVAVGGTTLVLSDVGEARYVVTVHDVSGKTIRQVRPGAAGLDMARQGLHAGYYVVRVARDGILVRSIAMTVPVR